MAEVTWFKVLTDIFADDKIKIIQSMPEGDALLVMWFKVLSQAGKTNDGGYIYLRKNIPYSFAMLATLFNKPQMMVELAMRTFSQFEMIDIDEKGYIFVTNWERHQSIDKLNQIKEKTKLRVQNHREKKKLELQESNATVTLPKQPSNATDIELDIDKDITTTTSEVDTLEQAHLKVFGRAVIPSMMTDFISKVKKKGYTEQFLIELFLEAGESSTSTPNLRYIDTIFRNWDEQKIYSRVQAKTERDKQNALKNGKEKKVVGSSYFDHKMELQRRNENRNDYDNPQFGA